MEGLLLLLFIACLVISFLMSGMEAGVFALNRLRLRRHMRKGNPRARVLYGYLENPEDFLWTILVGNTVANVIIFCLGVLALHAWLWRWPGWLVVTLVAGVILFYAFFELLPKMLFRLYPNRLCMFLVPLFRAIHLFLTPLVAMMALFAGSLLRWSGGRRYTGYLFGSRDELRQFLQEAAPALSSEERTMINRVLDLQTLKVGQIAVPLAKVTGVASDTPIREVIATSRERGVSRLPVWQKHDGRQRIIGLVSLRTLIYQENVDVNKTAGDYLKPALYLDSEARVEAALRQMQRTGQRLAIVLGPDHQEVGVVSLQDILKGIFGEVSW